MQERFDPTPLTAEQFYHDLRFTAGALGVPFCGATTRRVLEVFRAEFEGGVTEMKTEAKPGGGLFYRFFDNGSVDFTRRAQEVGLIPHERTPLVTLQEEVVAAFPRAARAGVDFDTGAGLAKVWTFTGGPVPLAEVLRLPSLPASVRAHQGLMEHYGFKEVFFCACDFIKKTLNVYLGWGPELRTERWLQELVAETGGGPLPHDEVLDILASQTVTGGVALTFRWDRPDLQRWCVYALEVPYGLGPDSGVRLPRLPAFLERFRDEAPTLNQEPQYILGWSYGKAGAYLKMEKTYSRDARYFFSVQMGGDLAPAPMLAGSTL
jgi:hypothetical protein